MFLSAFIDRKWLAYGFNRSTQQIIHDNLRQTLMANQHFMSQLWLIWSKLFWGWISGGHKLNDLQGNCFSNLNLLDGERGWWMEITLMKVRWIIFQQKYSRLAPNRTYLTSGWHSLRIEWLQVHCSRSNKVTTIAVKYVILNHSIDQRILFLLRPPYEHITTEANNSKFSKSK